MDDDPRRSPLSGFRTVSLLTLVSRVLGFARDSAMAAVFGLGEILDAFTLAFRIPNLARSLFGEGALTTAFLPEFVATRDQLGEDAARRLAMAVARRLSIILAAIVAVIEITLWLLHRSGLTPYRERLVELLGLMTPYLMLICLTALAGAILQAERRFAWPAIAPALLNAWWLAAVSVIALLVSDPELRIRWIAASLVAGGGLQLLLPVLVLRNSGWRKLPGDSDASVGAGRVFRAMLPTVVAASISQFNTVLDSFLAWLLAAPEWASSWGGVPVIESGTAAALYFAQRMYQFPLGLIGVAVGTVLFPALAAHAARGQLDELRQDLTHGLAVAMSVALPASVGLVVLSGPVTAVLFQHGKFNATDALLTSRIMAIYGSVAWAAIALLLIQRGFFAVGDRITPLKTGLCAVAVNLVLIPVGAWTARGIGLAAATSLTTLFHLGLSLFVLRTHNVSLDWPWLISRFGRATAASIVMAAVCSVVLQMPLTTPIRLAIALVTGLASYMGSARLMRLDEPWQLLRIHRGPTNGDEENGPT